MLSGLFCTGFLHVCFEYLRPGQVNPMRSCRARSVYFTTLLLGRLSPQKRLTSIVHILSPETDNCPSWISRRKRMTVENIFMITEVINNWNLHERMLPTRRGRARNLLITSRTRIKLSHRGRLHVKTSNSLGDWIHSEGFLPFLTRGTNFMTSFLLSCTGNLFWKLIYSKRNEFTTPCD